MERLALVLLFIFVFSSYASAEPIDLEFAQVAVNGEYVQVLQEPAKPLTLTTVLKAYQQGQFNTAKKSFLNFGIGARPVWLHFSVNNPAELSQLRRLSVKTPWLDKISLYYLHNNKLLSQKHTGDTLAYDQRIIKSRYFEFDYDYPPGLTTVLLRIETPDPMVLPVYLHDLESAYADNTTETYVYGFVYGILFALSLYNLILFFNLKSLRYLFYTLYLSAFIMMNFTYSGHGYQWLWSDSPLLQLWFNPLFMLLYAFSGLLFTTAFLKTRENLPQSHQLVVYICVLVASIFVISVLLGSQVGALLVAFIFALVFPLIMVMLGALSLHYGNRAAKYFLIASVTHICMVLLTAMTVWGLVPYTSFGFHSLEFGMTVDAILLSIALADQLRLINDKKLYAEQLAMTDHLTGLNNRRAFYQMVTPLWNTGVRKHRDMSVLLLDIDEFKVINDRYGHAQGDELLVKLGTCLRDNARAGDLAARWGGEEFIIFLPETPLHEATEIAERIRNKISHLELKPAADNIQISVSIGLAHNVSEDISIDQLIAEADKYLYTAKKTGRNRVCAASNCS